MLLRKPSAALALLLTLAPLATAPAITARAQQVPDPNFKPPVASPAYKEGRGPVVLVDEGHNNFHTAYGRYLAFADLLRRDGYRVVPNSSPFTEESLKRARVLVIANAIGERNAGGNWTLPTPSAFTDEEVEAVRRWVKKGGALFLIVDHMPMPGAAERLGAAFGARWSNGYAVNEKERGPFVFRRDDGSLKEHKITRGRRAEEQVETVATFTGSAFQVEGAAEPLLVLGDPVVSIETAVAGQFTPEAKRVPVGGWYQGAVLRYGRGRVALFGEAAMFTAQLAGPQRRPMGMNAPPAAHNPRLLLNVMHWLSGKL